jgi:predicted exporter
MSVRSRVTLVWLAAIIACAVYATTRLRVDADFSAFLPAVTTTEQRFLVAQLKEGVASRLLLIEINGDTAERLAVVSGALAERLAADRDDFRYVNNGDAQWGQGDLETIRAHRYQLSDAAAADRFSADALRTALESDLRALATGAGLIQKQFLAEDPTGETLHVVNRLTPRNQPRRERGVWFSADGSAALLVAETQAAGSDLDGQGRALAALESAFAVVHPGIDAKLRYSSPGAMAVQSKALIAADATRLALVSALLILVVLAVVYRSARVVALCAAPALTGLVVGIPAVDVAFGGVHAITLGFGATLLGEAVDYPSYVLTQVRAGEEASTAVARLARTLAMAVLTTAAASVALLLTGFQGLAQLGLLTMVGVLSAGAATAWVLPRWVPAQWQPVQAPMFLRTWRLPLSAPARVALAAALALALLAFSAAKTWWDDDLANMNPLPESLKQGDRELRAALGAPDVRWMLLIDGASAEDVLQTAERLRPTLEQALAAGMLGGFELVSDYLPSEATQRRRRAALPDAADLRANFASAANGLPLRIDAFEPFFAAVARARNAPSLDGQDLAGTALGLKLEGFLRRDDGRWYGVVPLTGTREPGTLRSAVAGAAIPNVRWIDLQAASRELMFEFRTRALTASAAGAFLILAALAVGLRSLRAATRIALPVIVAVMATAALLVALGFRLTVFHLVALMLVAGVGTNYALFLGRGAAGNEAHATTLRSLGVVAATTLCAFGVLATSRAPVLRAIGATVSVGVLMSLTFAMLLPLWHAEPEPAR